jgi:hypothetical protein
MCEEKKRLLQWHEQLQLSHGKALTALNQQAGLVSRNEFAALRHAVEVARVEAERARVAFDAHVLEHKC